MNFTTKSGFQTVILFKLFQQLQNLFLPSHALSLSLCAALLVCQNGPKLGFGALSLSLSLSLSFSSFAARDKILAEKTHFIILNRNFYTIFQVTASLFFFFPWLFIA
jgi:hypothetical protein